MSNTDGNATWRAFLRGTAAGFAVVTGAVAGLSGTSGSAWSEPGELPNPPQPGDRYSFGFRAPRTPLTVASTSAHLDVRGELAFEITASDPRQPWDVRMRITRFRATGSDAELGPVTLDHRGGAPESRLVVTDEHPARWTHTVLIDLVATVENPPSSTAGPLVLRAKEPVRLSGEITTFPPQGELYGLTRPVALVAEGGDSAGAVEEFPAEVGTA